MFKLLLQQEGTNRKIKKQGLMKQIIGRYILLMENAMEHVLVMTILLCCC